MQNNFAIDPMEPLGPVDSIGRPLAQPLAAPRPGAQAATDFERQVYCVLGLPVDAVTPEQVVDSIEAAARERRRCLISTPNLNFLIGALDQPAFRDSVIRSDLSTVDGQPLVWAARLLGTPIRQRVAGSTVFERLRARPQARIGVYFFGGASGAAARAGERINRDAAASPGVRCVGSCSPGYGSVEALSSAAAIDAINASGADFLVVALGAQKGQAWIMHNLARLQVPVVSHLGAVVNLVAGTISRAPSWVQRCALEWLWRIKEEPLLWRRYAHDGLALLRLIATRLIPCVIVTRLTSPGRDRQAPSVHCLKSPDKTRLVLAGCWHARALAPLRSGFTAITAEAGDIELDLGAVQSVDSATLGLLLLLYGHQQQVARSLRLVDVPPAIRRLFKLHCVAYLLDQTGVATSADDAGTEGYGR